MVNFNRIARACRLGLVAVLLGIMAMAHAQPLPSLPDGDKQKIKNYTLNEDVFNRLVAASKDARAQGIRPQTAPDPTKVRNLDDLVAQAMAGDDRLPALVKQYGFTPREFLLANLALVNAILVVQSHRDATLAKNLNPIWINSENVRFVEAHQAQVTALLSGGP